MELNTIFSEIIGSDYVIDDVESKKPFECDGLSVYREMPKIVVLPETVEQIQQILKICAEQKVPVVTRGAGTGLSAGALPHPEGVLLCMSRFNRILDIDPIARTAYVEPGVRNISISEEAAKYGLFYGPDPSSQIACTIGGNIAENSGGVHCLKYGLTVNNVLKIEFLTIDGKLLEVGSEGLDNCGYDLLALMHGSEGMLGIVTAAIVKLLPKPDFSQVIVAGFDSVKNAGDTVSAIIAQGIIPAALEMMDSSAIKAVEDFCHPGYPKDATALLLCEVDGTESEVINILQKLKIIFQNFNATSIRISQNDEERALLWKGRKSAFPAIGKISPDYYCMDGTVPRGKLARVLTRIAELSQQYGLRVANMFHAGDGNLHPLIMFDANVPGELERAENFGSEILKLCVKVGGSITGEHGVGIEKLRQMPVQFSDAEISQFHRVKSAFDPLGLLNPGKGIPSLKYCQEYRVLEAGRSH